MTLLIPGDEPVWLPASGVMKFLSAMHFACTKHSIHPLKPSKAFRKSACYKMPYIEHPIAVALTLTAVGGIFEPEVLVSAILHDVLEDTDTSIEELTREFGPFVCCLVQDLTEDKDIPKAERREWWVQQIPKLSLSGKQIKMADILCNVTDIITAPPDWPEATMKEYLNTCRHRMELIGKESSEELYAAFEGLTHNDKLPDFLKSEVGEQVGEEVSH